MTIISVALFLITQLHEQPLHGEMLIVHHLCGADISTLTEQLKITTLKYVKLPLTMVSKVCVASNCSCNSLSVIGDSVKIRIERAQDGANSDEQNLPVIRGQGLSTLINCSIKSDSANFSVPLTWKHNNVEVQTLSGGQQTPGIYQVKVNNIQQLYINKTKPTDGDEGVYSCEYLDGNITVLSKSFTLDVTGMPTVV